ncbi:thioredoxin family protein [Xenophilus arseniciresistens]|uniref:Thioredoxin family protein n=1 Tax=Xenophilus arseniciresistens TaxID=1283306 RepID=A0AAE3T0Q2_9BURK|nr:thioredoxin family protein [Xenophilus arseniciresistens]MDA7417186.1 thioredoxin family protein [Xenophilus arseniciresistens]
MSTPYATEQPTRAEVDAQPGLAVLEFGANWCGICKAAQPAITEALADAPAGLKHLKVEDGSGRPLGRSFRVKLWPTLIFLRDGQEVARVVRPGSADDVRAPLAQLGG